MAESDRKLTPAELASFAQGVVVVLKMAIRIHSCLNCGYTVPRDVASSQVIELRGLKARTEPCRKVIPSFIVSGGSAEALVF